MKLPIINDATSAASALVSIRPLPARVLNFNRIEIIQAAPYAASLSPVVGVVNIMCTTAEGLLFHVILKNHLISLQVSSRLGWRTRWAVLLKIWTPWHVLALINLLKGFLSMYCIWQSYIHRGGRSSTKAFNAFSPIHALGCLASPCPHLNWLGRRRTPCPTACPRRTFTSPPRQSLLPVSPLSNSCFAPLMLFWGRWIRFLWSSEISPFLLP